jgi:sec-independent protein translocase protein TatA
MGIGIPELIVILLVILLFVGPKKLPEAGESLGKALRSFKKAMSGSEEKTVNNTVKTEETEVHSNVQD